jgi:hypothetical protein
MSMCILLNFLTCERVVHLSRHSNLSEDHIPTKKNDLDEPIVNVYAPRMQAGFNGYSSTLCSVTAVSVFCTSLTS